VALAPLLFVLLTACAGQPQSAGAERTWAENSHAASTAPEDTSQEKCQPAKTDADGGTTVEAILPEDVLDKKVLDKPPPEYVLVPGRFGHRWKGDLGHHGRGDTRRKALQFREGPRGTGRQDPLPDRPESGAHGCACL
jgi:hypothetical protein